LIAANEGAAVALAVGSHLANGNIPLVYLQNSGLGNIINPLTSLVDPEVYSIPMIILIGWRGEPGESDEPQHRKQGRVMNSMFDALEIPYRILPDNDIDCGVIIEEAMEITKRRGGPVALVARKDTFTSYRLKRQIQDQHQMTREAAIKIILDTISPEAAVVSTTGMTSREVFENRVSSGTGQGRDFLTVGSMGHASQIALGISLMLPDRQIFCIDGDGAALMHLGSMGVSGTFANANFKHILINNGAHDSVGGQPTVGFDIDFVSIAKACGYAWAATTNYMDELKVLIYELEYAKGPGLLEIKVNKGARDNLGRPTSSPLENKLAFMKYLRNNEN
jgi:phosphonopyruvate decarboxylase